MEQQLRYHQERLDMLEEWREKHVEEHARFEAMISENTRLTKSIADNTEVIVDLIRGAKGLRSFLVWAAPLVAFLLGLWAWLKTQAGS